MALEGAAFRLYAPYFGYSIYVWGSMIAVVMLALAAGYGLGGCLADRSRTDLPLHAAVFGSAVYQLALLFVAHRLLTALARQGDFGGTVIATLAIFAPPMTALAMAGPFVIRLLARLGHVGSTAGQVYALSTAASMAGILGTTFWLLPQFGTQRTLETICVVTAGMGVLGLLARRRWAIVLAAPFLLLAAIPPVVWSEDTIWIAESAYNLVRVVRQGERMMLLLNSRTSVHTVRDETGWTGRYYDDFVLGPLLVPVHRALTLGMGGGASIQAARLTAPDAEFDAVEIDPRVVEAGRRFFGIQPDRRLRIHTADARRWLTRNAGIYDLVQVDLYHGGPYVPFYLTTVEFFHLVREHMSEGGLLMMNVFDVSTNQEVLASTTATLRKVVGGVYVFPAGYSTNKIVFAFAGPVSLDTIRARLASAGGTAPWAKLAAQAGAEILPATPPPDAVILTDDRAPVEEMTRRMLAE